MPYYRNVSSPFVNTGDFNFYHCSLFPFRLFYDYETNKQPVIDRSNTNSTDASIGLHWLCVDRRISDLARPCSYTSYFPNRRILTTCR